MAEPSTKEWIQSLVEPGLLLFWAMSCIIPKPILHRTRQDMADVVTDYVRVNFEAVFKRGQVLAPFLQTSKLRDEAFMSYALRSHQSKWPPKNNRIVRLTRSTATLVEGPPSTPGADSAPTRIQAASDLIPGVLARASGVVLDVGPGTGTHMPLLQSPAIKAIYGAEPCVGLHAELRARVEAEALVDKYRIVPSSVAAADLIPALEKQSLSVSDSGAGVFDTIICVRVLCSVPDMQRTVCELYGLLRPGGQLLVVEHVVNPWRTAKGSVVARVMQAVYGFLGWSWYVGDCCLNRDTETALREAAEADGGWESVELDRWFGRSVLPYVSGVLVKRGGINIVISKASDKTAVKGIMEAEVLVVPAAKSQTDTMPRTSMVLGPRLRYLHYSVHFGTI
ncbi:phospholipid methyltransferase [Penicillium cosmopolitanum]|uniref:Phospholipid methyltransferase n=1 Tax=Penicillium cosmopolitanum TaxID=1131564 RepID=A0A9W9W6I5_9EURO|nr:phospholipid methyltransferase [Penicillium cosmopolitanum]KAJ5404211.1 phospholipid methyltransferase [Penicillium cosmopolitanum]